MIQVKQFAVALLLATVCIGCGKKQAAESEERAAIPVRTIVVNRAEVGAEHEYSGIVEEVSGSMLSFEVAGNVEQISVNAGDRVAKGQIVARVNSASLRDIHQSQRAILHQAKDAYSRYKQLHDAGSLPDIKWIEVESKLQQAVAAENIARKKVGDCVLRAPFSGVIASKLVEAGMNVMPGSPVLKLVDIDRVDVKIAIPENEVARVKVGQKAEFAVSALDGRVFETNVSERGVVANPLSHTYEVKMRVQNTDGQLMPGMVCNVRLWEEGEALRMVVPVTAIQVDTNGKQFVWSVQNGKALRRNVVTDGFSGRGVVVISGLSDGDNVVVEGNQKISDGMKVVEK